jgi:y4mF family transcriptional regulator
MTIASPEEFGRLLKETRKKLAMTQPQLAAACGVGVRFIVELERGKPSCELGKALRVAEMLGIRFEAHTKA